MRFEVPTRLATIGLAAAIGTIGVSGCGGEKDPKSWVGCERVKVQPGVLDVGPSIFKRLEELDNESGTQTDLRTGVRQTNRDAQVAFGKVYRQVYGEDGIVVQAGDVFPICIDKDRAVSFNDAGEILVRDERLSYTQHHGEWRPT